MGTFVIVFFNSRFANICILQPTHKKSTILWSQKAGCDAKLQNCSPCGRDTLLLSRHLSVLGNMPIGWHSDATSSECGCKPSVVHETLYRMDMLQYTCRNQNFSSHLFLANCMFSSLGNPENLNQDRKNLRSMRPVIALIQPSACTDLLTRALPSNSNTFQCKM